MAGPGIGNEPCPAPHQVEGVALGATIGILNPYDRRAAAAAWVLDQLLSSAAIDAAEPKLTRIRRHRPRTLKPPPLGRLSGQRSQEAAVAADFNLRGAVHVNLDGALARIVTAASGEVCPALPGLGPYGATRTVATVKIRKRRSKVFMRIEESTHMA